MLPETGVDRSNRLFAPVMAQSADENADPPHRAVEHGLRDPGDLGRTAEVDDRGAMLRRRPGAQFFVNDFHELETEKHPVVDPGPKKAIELRFHGELLNFRGAE